MADVVKNTLSLVQGPLKKAVLALPPPQEEGLSNEGRTSVPMAIAGPPRVNIASGEDAFVEDWVC